MGVPFNFSCSEFGVYVCSRCGFELFSSSDVQISQTQPSRPVSFTKALNINSIIKLSSGTSPETFKIVCGKCRIPVGLEHFDEGQGGRSLFDVYTQSIRFVPSKRCSVPLSFLL